MKKNMKKRLKMRSICWFGEFTHRTHVSSLLPGLKTQQAQHTSVYDVHVPCVNPKAPYVIEREQRCITWITNKDWRKTTNCAQIGTNDNCPSHDSKPQKRYWMWFSEEVNRCRQMLEKLWRAMYAHVYIDAYKDGRTCDVHSELDLPGRVNQVDDERANAENTWQRHL